MKRIKQPKSLWILTKDGEPHMVNEHNFFILPTIYAFHRNRFEKVVPIGYEAVQYRLVPVKKRVKKVTPPQ